jgi:hypothetical protein
MFSKRTENAVIDDLNKYLKDIYPHTPYWKAKHTWAEMVQFRNDFSKKKIKSGFIDDHQSCILKWGGIYRFNHYGLLKDALQELNQNRINSDVINRISSMLKLFSFYDPSCYFILDARVALAINHLIKERKTNDLFIPFNPSKSKGGKVRSALFRFNEEDKFQDLGAAYLSYNALVLSVFNNITIPNGLPKKPEIIEMALFSMAEGISESYLNVK